MTLFLHELRSSWKALVLWILGLGGSLFIIMLLFPSLKGSMGEMENLFNNMGAFSQMFNLEAVNLSSPIGFYAVESGNIVVIGSALFAASLAISILSKEEGRHTAEFLFSHPISRTYVVSSKLAALLVQILLLNLALFLIGYLTFPLIGEEVSLRQIFLIHLANTFMNIHLAAFCFLISAFLSSGGMGVGIGIAMALYFINLMEPLSDKLSFVQYVSPFYYATATAIVEEGDLAWPSIILGMGVSLVCLVLAYLVYKKKDLQI